jgi:hypothetical protein
MPVNGSFATSLWSQVGEVQLFLSPAWLDVSTELTLLSAISFGIGATTAIFSTESRK